MTKNEQNCCKYVYTNQVLCECFADILGTYIQQILFTNCVLILPFAKLIIVTQDRTQFLRAIAKVSPSAYVFITGWIGFG